MSAPIVALPYGMRDVKLTPYTDGAGTILGSTSVDLANMQTFKFAETEEFAELRGDDKLVATRGKGSQVEFELEAGGISVEAWKVLTGGTVTVSGTGPTSVTTLRKLSTSQRPYFRAEGRAISDSGGDTHAIVYRCRINDNVEGEFKDGEFFTTGAKGLGMPLLSDTFDLLYDFVFNTTATAIPTTPVANPTGP
jgi:hypothetical protein